MNSHSQKPENGGDDCGTPASRLTVWTRAVAVACLPLACWHASGYTTVLDEAQFFWKIFYAVFLASSLWILAFSARGKICKTRWWWFDLIACTYTFVPIMQLTIPSPRPDGSSVPYFYGFPSGHMVSSFGMAWLISKLFPKLGPCWFAGAVLLGWARIISHDHVTFQVLGGALFGSLLACWIERSDEGIWLPRIWHWFRRSQQNQPAR